METWHIKTLFAAMVAILALSLFIGDYRPLIVLYTLGFGLFLVMSAPEAFSIGHLFVMIGLCVFWPVIIIIAMLLITVEKLDHLFARE